jgi:hypothetical protein
MKGMKKLLPAVVGVLLCIPAPILGDVPVMDFDDVRAGMKGTGLTVFSGTEIEAFEVEILGKLSNIGPDQDLILARCSGGPLARTGVLAGMSGSPVTVDGRLIGAISYAWNFTKEPIAGITPIAQMLEIAEIESAGGMRRSAAVEIDERRLAALRSPGLLAAFLSDELTTVLQRPAGALPISMPLSVSGMGAAGLEGVERHLGGAGFLPLQSGGAGRSAEPSPPLQPGSAVGLKLVRGDIDMTATGTVTWVEGDSVLAFGHPLFGLGSVDLPLTGARVELLLPSLMRSTRLATPLSEAGSLRQDRASGVFGLLGAEPRMIPVRFKLAGAAVEERVYSFDIADDPLLAPLLLYVSLNGILSAHERTFGSTTVRLAEGSVIKMAGDEDVEFDNIFSGARATEYGTGIAAYILHLLMNNAWSEPRIAGVNLILDYDPTPHNAAIRRVGLDRYRVRAGETVSVRVVLSPYRGREEMLTAKVKIPKETPPGTLQVHVGSAVAVSRAESYDTPVLPRDLDQLVKLINQLRRNDRIYITATGEDNGVLLGGSRLPNLPPSAATILSIPGGRGNLTPVPRRSVLEEIINTDYAVEGSAKIELQVEAP